MPTIRYPTFEEVVSKHDEVLAVSGGAVGLRDKDGLESTLDRMQSDLYYPEFYKKMSYLIYNINKTHFFIDGNKRTALAAGSLFLLKNGICSEYVNWYLKKFEDIMLWLASSEISSRELEIAVVTMLVRFMMLDRVTSPAINRKIKKKVREFIFAHKRDMELDSLLGIDYYRSHEYYVRLNVMRFFEDMDIRY